MRAGTTEQGGGMHASIYAMGALARSIVVLVVSGGPVACLWRYLPAQS